MQIVGSGGDYIAEWVADRLGMRFAPPYEAVGIYDNDGRVLAGVVYHMKREANIEMSIAADSPRWASKHIIHDLLSYPFREGCGRITALARVDNARSRRLLDGVGFVHEGTMRSATSDGVDYLVYGLTHKDFKEGHYG